MKTYDKHRELMLEARYLNPADDALQAFEDTIKHRGRHVPNVNVPSLGPTTRRGKILKFGVVDYAVRLQNGVEQTTITLVTKTLATTLTVADTDAFYDALLALIFSDMPDAWQWYCPNGEKRFIQYFKTSLMKGLSARGYGTTGIKINTPDTNLRVSKGKTSWWVSDYNKCHGVTFSGTDYDALLLDDLKTDHQDVLKRFYAEVETLQRFYAEELGVSMKRTNPSSGAAVFARHMSKGSCLSRPSPQVFAVCREGGLLRQGYQYHEIYDGLGSSEDVRRQYTSLLAMDHPQHVVLDHAVINGERQKGFFLCRVRGEGVFPARIAIHDPTQRSFIKGYWNGGNYICWLADTEYEGLEAFGFTVEPLFGYRIDEWFNVRPLVEKLQRLTDIHDPKSSTGQVLKLIGNATIGRFQQQHSFVSYRYCDTMPEDYYPLQDIKTSVEIPNVFIAEEKSFLPSQQPLIACRILGASMTQLALRMMFHHNAGRRVLHAATDGLIIQGGLEDVFYNTNPRFGEMRLEQQNTPLAIIGINQYRHGEVIKNMGGASTTLRHIATKFIKVAPAPIPAAEAPPRARLNILSVVDAATASLPRQVY